VKAEVVPVTEAIADDPEIQKVIAPLAAEIQASFGLPLAQAPQGLFRGRRGEENLLGYWVSDVMRQAAQLKVGDIFELMPFENELVVIELTGAEVIQAVKEGLLRRGGEPCSGVKVKVEGTPQQATLTITWEDGSAIDPAAVVKVATTDYLYGGGDSIPTLKKGRKPFTTGITLRQMLLDHCAAQGKAGKDLLPPSPGRFSVPVPILEAIRDKTFKL
jgi:2',3'-cyclic-nucleotide 2'-phosphodiesterase (5'-nucleotidase family)